MAIHVHLDFLGEPTDIVDSSQFSWESVITKPFSLMCCEGLEALVKMLKIERKIKFYNKMNNFLTFKK